MDPTGPDGAPRDDGLDVRWGSDWQYIVSLYPDTKPYLWGLAAAIYDQALRAERDILNPFWREEPAARAERPSIPADSGDAVGASTRLGPEPTLRNASRVSPLEGEPMTDPTSFLPPNVRAGIYLLLLCASVVLTPLALAGTIPSLYSTIAQGLLGVFASATALANVNRAPTAVLHAEVYDPKHD